MVKTRLSLIIQSGANIIQAGQIAVRYAICRRQFANQVGSQKERKLLDYQKHMAVIAPHIANGMTILINFRLIKQLSAESDANVAKGNFKTLEILHHFTAGIKALACEMQYVANDELR